MCKTFCPFICQMGNDVEVHRLFTACVQTYSLCFSRLLCLSTNSKTVA